MKFLKFYLLIFTVLLSLNTNVLAQSNDEDYEEQVKDLVADQKTSYYYLLGTIGYNGLVTEDTSYSGFAFAVLGGWQQSRFFAMDVAVGYSNLSFSSIDLKYALLFQTSIKLSPSWSILPKVGLGASGSYIMVGGGSIYNAGVYGTLGLRATYKKIIAGISYEHTLVSRYLENDFKILVEAGIRF